MTAASDDKHRATPEQSETDLSVREAKCEKHGVFQQSRIPFGRARGPEIWSYCPACVEEVRQERERDEAERKRELRETAIAAADIPKRFLTRDFNAFLAESEDKRRALTVARDFAEQFPENLAKGAGLVFAGLPGTGKTHLAVATLLALVGRHSVRYTTCSSLIRMVRDTWRRDSELSESQVLYGLCENVALLAIDEIGVQYGTDSEQNLLFEIMDRRYSGLRPTILLTNQDKDGFKSFVGDRVFDRLRETSRWVPFDWPSYRATARGAA